MTLPFLLAGWYFHRQPGITLFRCDYVNSKTCCNYILWPLTRFTAAIILQMYVDVRLVSPSVSVKEKLPQPMHRIVLRFIYIKLHLMTFTVSW